MYNTFASAGKEGKPSTNETKPLFCGPGRPVCVGETATTAVVYLAAHQRNKMTEVLLRSYGDEAGGCCLSCQLWVNEIWQQRVHLKSVPAIFSDIKLTF